MQRAVKKDMTLTSESEKKNRGDPLYFTGLLLSLLGPLLLRNV